LVICLELAGASPQKSFSLPRAGDQALTSGLYIRLSLFNTSNVNALIINVAIMSRRRYVWGHGKRRNYCASS
jgi:hypothetical protein